MKNVLSLLMVIFLFGISTANEKNSENFNSQDSNLACWGLSVTVNTTTDVLTITGTPATLMVIGEYIDVEIWDQCGNKVYDTIKTFGSNSLVISKSSFTSAVCLSDGNGNQYYDVYISWNASNCGVGSISQTIFF